MHVHVLMRATTRFVYHILRTATVCAIYEHDEMRMQCFYVIY